MTTDYLNSGIKAWITAQVVGTALEGIMVVTSTPDSEQEPPFIAVTDAGAEEFNPNYGCLRASVTVELVTVPGAADQETTQQAEHQTLATALWCILQNYQGQRDYITVLGAVKVFEILGNSPRTEASGDVRQTTFDVEYVVAPTI